MTVDSYQLCRLRLDLDRHFEEGTPTCSLGSDLLPLLPSRREGGLGPGAPLRGDLAGLCPRKLWVCCLPRLRGSFPLSMVGVSLP